MQERRLALIALVFAAFAYGCGDDDAPGDDETAPDSGTPGAGGSGGAGGSSGSGGAGSGGSGGAQATAVTCGTATCEAPAAAMGFIAACCADDATSTCGTSIMGGPCGGASEGDPRCPGLDGMGFFMLPSCCTDDSQCGIDASMFSMPGCIDLETAAEQAAMMGMSVDIPSPQSCGDADAGTEDAGS